MWLRRLKGRVMIELRPVTQDEAQLLNGRTPAGSSAEDTAAPIPQFMGIDLYPCTDAMQRRKSLR